MSSPKVRALHGETRAIGIAANCDSVHPVRLGDQGGDASTIRPIPPKNPASGHRRRAAMTDHRRRSTRATIRVETLEDRLAPVPVNPSHAHLVAIGGAALAHAMGDHRLPDGNTGGSHRS